MFRCLLSALLVLVSANVKSDSPVYKAVGGIVELKPGSVGPFSSITWKHGGNMAIDWSQGKIEAYRHFKDRGHLNILTGILTITGLTREDSGIYKAEINGIDAQITELVVMSPVSKPNITYTCVPGLTSCSFTCEADTTGVEHVTYSWRLGDELLLQKSKEITIKKEEAKLEFILSCTLENRVSTESSTLVNNPFSSGRNHNALILSVIVIVTVIAVVVIVVVIYIYKRKQTQENHRESEQNPTSDVSPEPNHEAELLPATSRTPETATIDPTQDATSTNDLKTAASTDSSSETGEKGSQEIQETENQKNQEENGEEHNMNSLDSTPEPEDPQISTVEQQPLIPHTNQNPTAGETETEEME